ncbi:hypothetical protein OAU77_03995, partial [Gammaproteobacteria bacterium]|nr:hypothetical protein [Gammaproteobacteria bacterium]
MTGVRSLENPISLFQKVYSREIAVNVSVFLEPGSTSELLLIAKEVTNARFSRTFVLKAEDDSRKTL